MAERIRIMLSSRTNDYTSESGETIPLREIRARIESELEATKLFADRPFEVFAHEHDPVSNVEPVWESCLTEARESHILLALVNGHSGGGRENGSGICHAELASALATQGGKVRVVRIPKDKDADTDGEFYDLFSRANYNEASEADEIVAKAKEAVLSAILEMVDLGARSSRGGRYSAGEALDWSRLDYGQRCEGLRNTLMTNLLERGGIQVDSGLASHNGILFACHALPDRMAVPQARAILGRPFLRDIELASHLQDLAGPVHVAACYRNATEIQAKSVVGLDDLFVATPGFGVYVVDRIHKNQLVFLANCRDRYETDEAFRTFWSWLGSTNEGFRLKERARSRARIVALLQELRD